MKKVLSGPPRRRPRRPVRGNAVVSVAQGAKAGRRLRHGDRPSVTDIVKKTVATGSVIPRKEVAVKPQVSGIIESIRVEPGQDVKRGDLLASIRVVPNTAALAAAESRVHAGGVPLRRRRARVRPAATARGRRHRLRQGLPAGDARERHGERGAGSREGHPGGGPARRGGPLRERVEHQGHRDDRRHGARRPGEGRRLGHRDQHLQRRHDHRDAGRHVRADLRGEGGRIRGRQAEARHGDRADDRRAGAGEVRRHRSSTSLRRGSTRTARSSSRSARR